MDFKDFLATLITILCFALWLLPAVMYWHTGKGEWGILYLPITLITAGWLTAMYQKYFN